MNIRFLKKIKKRFSWRYNENMWTIIDHKEKQAYTFYTAYMFLSWYVEQRYKTWEWPPFVSSYLSWMYAVRIRDRDSRRRYYETQKLMNFIPTSEYSDVGVNINYETIKDFLSAAGVGISFYKGHGYIIFTLTYNDLVYNFRCETDDKQDALKRLLMGATIECSRANAFISEGGHMRSFLEFINNVKSKHAESIQPSGNTGT